MIPLTLLLEHIKGLLAVWAIVLLAGIPTSYFLRVRLGFPGYVLLGVVYWAVSLYVFCFDGGLLVATGLAGIGFGVTVWKQREPWRHWLGRNPNRLARGLLFLGCVPYVTVMVRNYVPMGVDAGMVGASARMIALHHGLPTNYAPWFPELFFPSVNLAIPTIGSLAINIGCEPGSVVLGLAQMVYSAWILATYILLRLWTRPVTAALLAVAQAWGARWAQNTIGWGGFPTVAGMAVGLFALRLMWDALRDRGTWRSLIPFGLSVGAIPLVHGISAAVWVYAVAPVVGLVLLVRSTQRRQLLLKLAGAAAISVAILASYVAVGRFHMSQEEIDWSQKHMTVDAPPMGTGLAMIGDNLKYLSRYSGSILGWVAAAGFVALMVLGRYRVVAALASCLLLLLFLLINSHWWVLPFSLMLYPDRSVYWAGPLAALTIGLAWQSAAARFAVLQTPRVHWLLGGIMLGLMFVQHINQYQRDVFRPPTNKDGWLALQWAERNLTKPGTLVRATYGSVATFLPACANVPTTAWQIHHCAMDEANAMFHRLRPTHWLCVNGVDSLPTSGTVVFQNATVTIIEMPTAKDTP